MGGCCGINARAWISTPRIRATSTAWCAGSSIPSRCAAGCRNRRGTDQRTLTGRIARLRETVRYAAPVQVAERAPAKQPRGLFLLFGVEMWERFSFYGMRAMLVFFLTDVQRGGFGWSKPAADKLFGTYGFCAYALPLAGGFLADRFIGTHRSMVIGACIIAAGHFCLAIPATPTFFAGLILVVIGTGFFKPNVSTMVGQLYRQGDPRRDGGFTLFY